MAKKNPTEELMELLQTGCFDIVQQYGDHDEEPYEGCTHNLFMWLESGEATVTLLDETDPRARKGAKTFTMEMSTFMGDAVITIWEI